MSKKQDFLRSEQSRDKHPENLQAGSAASEELQGSDQANKRASAADRQAPHSGKLANDHNKVGDQHPTQKNEGQRTPQSRHEREVMAGTNNNVEVRTGGKGGGRSPRGAG